MSVVDLRDIHGVLAIWAHLTAIDWTAQRDKSVAQQERDEYKVDAKGTNPGKSGIKKETEPF